MIGIPRETQTLFDGIFKRLLELSDIAIIQLINGVFDEVYSPESKVERISTEFVSGDLRKQLLDVLIKIDEENLCHIEAQITDDADMVIRMFEYGYAVAMRYKRREGDITTMRFPKAKVIYWETTSKTPDRELLRLEFPDGTYHNYEVDSLKPLDHSIDELEQQKLAVLLPFYTLKLRKRVKRAKTSEERQALAEEMQTLLEELVEAIMRGEKTGVITEPDKRVLLQHIAKLIEQVYKQEYEEFEEVDSMLQGAILTYSEEAAIEAATKAKEEGEAIGVKKAHTETLRNMMKSNLTPEQMSEYSGIPLEEVNRLLKELEK